MHSGARRTLTCVNEVGLRRPDELEAVSMSWKTKAILRQMHRRQFRRFSAAVATLLLSTVASQAQQLGESRGESLVIQHCGMCHGVARAAPSPNPLAPPLGNLASAHLLESAERALRQGKLAGHPEMPTLTISSRDAEAIIRYLRSIQVR
jgi:mono/diheme cytochrome c family protein